MRQTHPFGSVGAAEDTCNIWYIRRRLGRQDYKDKRITAYVTKLVEQRDFPRPLPDMSTHRRELIDAVTISSRWIRAAVETWFDNYLPPEASAALDDAARQAAAEQMDAAAGNLLHVVGARRR